MIIHNVFFKVKPQVSEEAIELAFKQLFALKKQLPGILNISGGRCHFHEDRGQGYFTHGFSINFANIDSYQYFLESQLAGPAKGCIINITDGGLEGIKGFDISHQHIQIRSTNRQYRIQAPRLRLTPPGGIH